MNEEDISKLLTSKQKELYIEELEKRRQEIKFDVEIGHIFGTKAPKRRNITAITILDYWFLKICDDNPEVKKHLSFYYDCIKEGRYDKISKKLYQNREDYEYACNNHLRDNAFLEGDGAPSTLFSNLTKIIPDFSKGKEYYAEAWQEYQNRIADSLFRSQFHVNILIVGLSMSKSHPFIWESWISNEFGTLENSDEVPHLIKCFEAFKTSLGCTPPNTKDLLDNGWAVEVGIYEFSNLEEITDSTTVSEYLDYLKRVSDTISNILSKSNNKILDSFLFSFLRNGEDRNYSMYKQYLSEDEKFWKLSKKHIIDVAKHTCTNVGPYTEKKETINPQSFNYRKTVESTNEQIEFSEPNFLTDHDKLIFFVGEDNEDFIKVFLSDLVKKGVGIYGHSAILDYRFITFQRATLSLFNLSSGFVEQETGFYLIHSDIYRYFTVPVLAFGAGYYHKPS